jgi:hypoxanthine phosphoribosyltransferase
LNEKSSSPGRTLLSATALRRRVKELAASITAHYRGKPLTVLALLNGSVFFLVDLVRLLPPETQIECWRVRSYEGTRSGGQVRGLAHCEGDFAGRNVLIVDDILDTGLTLDAVRRRVLELGAARAEVCVLLRKKRKRTVKVGAKWAGFDIPDAFVIGYGLDLDGKYRSLKSIRVLEPSNA